MDGLQAFEADEQADAEAAARAMVRHLAEAGFRAETKKIGRENWLAAARVFLASWLEARAARFNDMEHNENSQ